MKKVTKTVLLILLILFISLALRLPFVGVPVLNGDEGDNFDTVKLYLEKGVSLWERMVFTPPTYLWMISFIASFFGLNEITLRSVSVFFGSLTPVLLFFFAKYFLGDERKAFVAGLLAAVIPFFVVYSRDAHNEATQVFFVLFALLALEFFLTKKQQKWCWWLTAAVITGLAVSVKYNAVLPLGLYWLFKIVSSKKEWKKTVKCAILINVVAFSLLVIMTGFEPVRLAYFAYGVLSWTVNQSTDANVPWYYYVSVLFEGLSPVLFVFFVIAFAWWLYRVFFGKMTKREMLVLFLCVFMLLVVFVQARKYPRHLMLVVPWIVLMVSDILVRFGVLLRVVHRHLPAVVLLFVITSAGLWSITKIELYDNHVVWRDVGKYVLESTGKDAVVFNTGIDLWPTIIYSGYDRKITAGLRTEFLKNGDVVILYDVNHSKPFVIGSPLQNDLFFHSNKYGAQYAVNQTFYEYALSKGVVVKEFPYDAVNKIKIIKITKARRQMQNVSAPKIKQDRVVQGICDVFVAHKFVQDVLQKFSKRLYDEVQMKCAKGCVRTCGMF